MVRKRIEKPIEHSSDISNETQHSCAEEIARVRNDMKVLISLLTAPLAFESLPDKIHRGWKRQLQYCEDRLKKLKAPLNIKRK